MVDLLAQFALPDVVTFAVLLGLSIKGAVTFFDWAFVRIKQMVHKDEKVESVESILKHEIEQREDGFNILQNEQTEIKQNLQKIYEKIDLLIESDRDDIKSWIIAQHHLFCNEIKEIDTYTLESIEKRYRHYVAENGNGFVVELMNEIRSLPKVDSVRALEDRQRLRAGGSH